MNLTMNGEQKRHYILTLFANRVCHVRCQSVRNADEFSRECLASVVKRKLTHDDVLLYLMRLFCERGLPVHIRSDNGSEFTAKVVRRWLGRLKVSTLFIEPGSSWENGYVESFNGKMRDELLAREIFYTLTKAQILVEDWRCHYNEFRPHSALGYQPPTLRAVLIRLSPRL